MAKVNRIKAALAEADKTNLWLAEKIGRDPVTVSKWCTNLAQPSLKTLIEVAKVLGVDVRELIVPTDAQKVIMTIKSQS